MQIERGSDQWGFQVSLLAGGDRASANPILSHPAVCAVPVLALLGWLLSYIWASTEVNSKRAFWARIQELPFFAWIVHKSRGSPLAQEGVKRTCPFCVQRHKMPKHNGVLQMENRQANQFLFQALEAGKSPLSGFSCLSVLFS